MAEANHEVRRLLNERAAETAGFEVERVSKALKASDKAYSEFVFNFTSLGR